ncbi:MAG TPA: hypothetical protein VGC34_01750, partial [Steroidobacteraceae bacterium]
MKGAFPREMLACGRRLGGLHPRVVLLWVVWAGLALQSGCAVGPGFHRPPAPRAAGFAPTP